MAGVGSRPRATRSSFGGRPPPAPGTALARLPNLQAADHRDQPASGGGPRQEEELLRRGHRAHHRLSLHPAGFGAHRHSAAGCQACVSAHRRCCRGIGRRIPPPANFARDGRLSNRAVFAHSVPLSSCVVCLRRRLARRPPPRQLHAALGAAARLRQRDRALLG